MPPENAESVSAALKKNPPKILGKNQPNSFQEKNLIIGVKLLF
jgi:hypothetical protein